MAVVDSDRRAVELGKGSGSGGGLGLKVTEDTEDPMRSGFPFAGSANIS